MYPTARALPLSGALVLDVTHPVAQLGRHVRGNVPTETPATSATRVVISASPSWSRTRNTAATIAPSVSRDRL
jgi:hypothetical protein